MRIDFSALAGAMLVTALFAAGGNAQSAPVKGTHQNLKFKSALSSVEHNGTKTKRHYRRQKSAAWQYSEIDGGTYPYHAYYGMRAWYPPMATFNYPLLW
jgi:hypothetical protein